MIWERVSRCLNRLTCALGQSIDSALNRLKRGEQKSEELVKVLVVHFQTTCEKGIDKSDSRFSGIEAFCVPVETRNLCVTKGV